MALKVWLPLNGNLENKGISDYKIRSANITIADDGKIGKCYSFNGSNSYINITNFEIGNNGSYGCGVNTPNSDSRGGEIVMILNNSGSDADSQFAFGVHQKENRFESLANTQYVSTIPYTNYYNNGHHFFATFNGTLLTTYIDGNVVNTKTITATQYNAVNLTIGARSTNAAGTSFASGFQGKLNDIRVYDHCLSPLEVKEISQGLILHYKLDGFNGGTGENLLSKYVSPGQQNPGVVATAGRTNYYGDYGIIIPATENADTYFRLFLDKQLEQNIQYTISCEVSGLLSGSYYNFPLFAQSNTAMGILQLNHNGICSLTFTMTYSTQPAVTVNGRTVYTCFMDDSSRSIASGQGAITIKNFKIEKGSIATSGTPALSEMGIDTTKIPDSSGYGNDGTIINTILTESDSPRYQINAHIDNVSSKIQIDNLQTSGFGNSYTFAGGAKVSSVNPMHGGFANGIRLNGMYTGRLGNTGDGSNNPLYNPGTTTQVTAPTVNTWHHWAMVGNGSKCLVYQDGQLGAEAKTYKAISGTTIYINGGDSGTSYCSDNLSISDFRIYATALSAEDIADLYHTPANIDNLQNMHTFEFRENSEKTSIYQNGITSTTNEIHESNAELLNTMSIGGYTPAKNIANSCTNFGYANFDNYASLGKDLAVHIECDVEWTAFTADTGGTFRGVWFQGANYEIASSSFKGAGTNYICSALNSAFSLQTISTITTAGKHRYNITTTIPASGFATYSRSDLGGRCDYSDGTGHIDIKNLKITPLQYYNAKIGENFISANIFIEK